VPSLHPIPPTDGRYRLNTQQALLCVAVRCFAMPCYALQCARCLRRHPTQPVTRLCRLATASGRYHALPCAALQCSALPCTIAVSVTTPYNTRRMLYRLTAVSRLCFALQYDAVHCDAMRFIPTHRAGYLNSTLARPNVGRKSPKPP